MKALADKHLNPGANALLNRKDKDENTRIQ
jgi:hypothetical protein